MDRFGQPSMQTELSSTQQCPRQNSAQHSDFPDRTQLNTAMSQTELSSTQRCLRQNSAQHSDVPDSAQLNTAMSQTALSSTQRWPRQNSASTSLNLTLLCPRIAGSQRKNQISPRIRKQLLNHLYSPVEQIPNIHELYKQYRNENLLTLIFR